MDEARMPILVGVGQVTEREFDVNSSSPLDLMEQAVWAASDDAGIGRDAMADLDALVIVKSFREPTRNSVEALAGRLGAHRARQWMMPDGGNGPQYLVNRFSESIARGECEFALFTGSEAMATGRLVHKQTGEQPAWQEPASGDPEYLVADKPLSTEHERKHGIWAATGFYAMCENALRHHHGKAIDSHQMDLGRLFARFTDVAAASPHAWYPVQRTAKEIALPSDQNRMVSWPYTKYMNAMNQINQSAALLLTSVDYARRLGINEDRFIYLHGCADTNELGILERPNYYASTAMQVMAEQVFADNALSMDDIRHIDFYSCFPSAVELAREAFGLAEDDPRDLTVTGGLPFHGGAGNNYVMNSIATMVEKLRADRGSYGLVTANGGYFSKHAAGIYSTNPVEGQWSRTHPDEYQGRIDNLERVPFTETPAGPAEIETYTVGYGRDNAPAGGTMIGRLEEGTRFVAMLPRDAELLTTMTRQDMIGTQGMVSQVEGLNLFVPAA